MRLNVRTAFSRRHRGMNREGRLWDGAGQSPGFPRQGRRRDERKTETLVSAAFWPLKKLPSRWNPWTGKNRLSFIMANSDRLK